MNIDEIEYSVTTVNKNLSNKSRIGLQYACHIQRFVNNSVFGMCVGCEYYGLCVELEERAKIVR